MSAKVKDLTGKIFDRLEVINFTELREGIAYFHCKCDCGNFCIKGRDYLSRKFIKSCGCIKRSGMTYMNSHRAYKHWQKMIARCTSTDKTSKHYRNYVMKSITYPDEWRDFKVFLADMGEPKDGETLDRVDNKQSYSKDNCRWATKCIQELNKGKISGCSSKYRGVSYIAKDCVWRAYFKHNGKQHHIGRFKDEISAARKRDDYIISLGWVEESLGASFKDYLNFGQE